MRATKLVVGILQIVISAVIVFQSTTVGIAHAMENPNNAGSTAGTLTAIIFLITGVVYIATKESPKLGGDIAGLIMMLTAWIFAINNARDYSDLQIWGWLAFIIGVGFFVWHLIASKKAKNA